jgi:hypothetical protein
VFVYSGWSDTNVGARVTVMSRGIEDSQLEVFRMELEKSAKTKGGGQAPAALAKSMIYSGLSEPEISKDGATLKERSYELTYLPPPTQGSRRYSPCPRAAIVMDKNAYAAILRTMTERFTPPGNPGLPHLRIL